MNHIPKSNKSLSPIKKVADSERQLINADMSQRVSMILDSSPLVQKRSLPRRVFSQTFNLLKPFLRPITFRFRYYLNSPLLERIEILQNLVQQQQLQTGLILSRLERVSGEAARRMAVSVGANKVMVLTQVGYVMCDSQDTAVVASLVDSGDLEKGTRLLIERLLKPGDHFVDIGANVGMHTLAAARALKGQGRVWAFEPFPSTRALLSESVLINGHSHLVEVHEAAISTLSGTSVLHLGKLSGHHSLYPLEAGDASEAATASIQLLRLSEVISDNTRVDFIKIDVEGAELDVLTSASALITNNPEVALIVEFGPSHLKRTGTSSHDWFAAFAQLGLSFQRIDDLTGELSMQSIEELNNLASCNLLFARPSASVWRRACPKA